ncbi:hypothetical protein ABS71_06425 [bacterium SCN 62-11]|nr:MAG: hypothetical protein ABS71_06425 [bacterium SCN 62-11]
MIETSNLTVATSSGRVLFQDLNLSLEDERVALVGRNGVGKSTLLETLAGVRQAHSGRVLRHSTPYLVGQMQTPQQESHGQMRRRRLCEAFRQAPPLLLLDEPTQDLDWEGTAWLRNWLSSWRGGALVASHDRLLLQDFEHFFVLSERGARYFQGSLSQLESELEHEEAARQADYVSGLHRMVEHEDHSRLVANRRARKQRYGRVREMDRAGPRIVLNMKRNQAQVTHGKQKAEREARLQAIRQFAQAGRRALQVQLPLVLPTVCLPSASARDILCHGDLQLRHQRVGVIGPNGSGKTTLIHRVIDSPRSDSRRFGSIGQGALDWLLEDSLLDVLGYGQAEVLVSHKFPLALAERPLHSLSPGERVRAALICLFQRTPTVEMLVLDEPTYSLDLLGKKALTAALRAWPGGLLVASHDLDFLRDIGVADWIRLE